MGPIGRHMRKIARKHEDAMALAYAEGAVAGAVRASPAPGKKIGKQTAFGVIGPKATGRTRAAIAATNDVPSRYDPGPKAGTYRIPKKRAARFHVRRRRLGQSVILSCPVPHLSFVLDLGYDLIQAGHEEGVRRVLALRRSKP